jgi:hypothetical protein
MDGIFPWSARLVSLHSYNHLGNTRYTDFSLYSPGRFFAAQQLKLLLAHVAMNYEIQPIATRPANSWFVGSSGPPLDITIKIRRREGTA